MYSLCVITPTVSRPTLQRALISAELAPGDEWLIVGDGPQQPAQGIVADLWQRGRKWLRFLTGPETHSYGNAQRDYGMSRAVADYFVFLDDDDVFTPGAIEAIRGRLDGGPAIFRMVHPNGIIWTEPRLGVGNVGGSMLVIPNRKHFFGKWADHTGHKGDADFIEDTLSRWRFNAKWCSDIIIKVGVNDLRC